MLLCLFLWLECVVPKHRNRTGDANIDIPQCAHTYFIYFIVRIYDVIQEKALWFNFLMHQVINSSVNIY